MGVVLPCPGMYRRGRLQMREKSVLAGF